MKNILYLLDYFQTYPNVKLIYLKRRYTNITQIFNIILICETYECVKNALVMLKLALITSF
jgi:hypothetical protein